MASKIYTADEKVEGQPLAPTGYESPDPRKFGIEQDKRKPGRPVGSKSSASLEADKLLYSDFHFLRAIIQGMDTGDAADRFLTHRRIGNRRSAERYALDLRKRLAAAVDALKEAAQVSEAKVRLDSIKSTAWWNGNLPQAVVQALPGDGRDGAQSAGPSVPTLAQFAEQFPEDQFSESDLMLLYEEEYGASPSVLHSQSTLAGGAQDNGSSSASRKEQIASINWLMDHLAVVPRASSPCLLWVEGKVSGELRARGVVNLGDLVRWINLTGRQWYSKLPGIGRARAQRLVLFLLQYEQDIGVELAQRIRFRLDERYRIHPTDAGHDERNLALQEEHGFPVISTGLVPLKEFLWPPELRGSDGRYRNFDHLNDYEVADDAAAVDKWLNSLERNSPATQDTYRRAIERLVLWAMLVRRRALSSLTEEDFRSFEWFLQHAPKEWCSEERVQKWSKSWRPLRGPLSKRSARLQLRVVSSMYKTWSKRGYLRLNPLPALGDGSSEKVNTDLPGSADKMRDAVRDHIDVARSFTDEDLDLIRRHFDQLKDGHSKRRLRAILMLLQTAGLRRAEASGSNWGHVSSMAFGHTASAQHKLLVQGKGGKAREIPLKPETLQALEDHYQDRMELVRAGRLPYVNLAREDTPLLSILDDRLTKSEGRYGYAPEDARRDGNETGRLSAHRIYMIVKDFFGEVALRSELEFDSVRQGKFKRASTHWMRHTFAHQTLAAADNNLQVVQDLLGHVDINTTTIYTRMNLEQRASAVNKIAPVL